MVHAYAIPPQQAELAFTFIARSGFPPKHSHICCTPWSVLQDGSDETILSASCMERRATARSARCDRTTSTLDAQHSKQREPRISHRGVHIDPQSAASRDTRAYKFSSELELPCPEPFHRPPTDADASRWNSAQARQRTDARW